MIMGMHKCQLILVLHAHLPWVYHPEHERSLEESWLFETLSETYIPLLNMLGRLLDEGIRFRITVSLSPTLLEMLKSPRLLGRFEDYMDQQVELADSEVRRTASDPGTGPVARMYAMRSRDVLESFRNHYRRDLPASFARLGASGSVELITTAASHPYLPNLAPFPRMVETQVGMGTGTFETALGYKPEGLWLPECGYFEGLNRFLARCGLGYFFSEGHALMHARPRPPHGVYSPVLTPGGPVAFGRDMATVQKVWSSTSGYPGDPAYRDFYRDIGFDLPLDYIGPYLHPAGIRTFTGFKYYRVTGPGKNKEAYRPEAGRMKAAEHADDFVRHLEGMLTGEPGVHGFSPLVVAPFDAELFGHWWFEGTQWLEHVLRAIAASRAVTTALPSQMLSNAVHTADLPLSSWGEGGYGRTWANHGKNTPWLARILKDTARMEVLATALSACKGPRADALRLGAAELIMGQASDWPFMIQNGPFEDYAGSRLQEHLEWAETFMHMAVTGEVKEDKIQERRQLLPAFSLKAIDYWRSLA
jgi:1,4-alpha-glucan branching enzyme